MGIAFECLLLIGMWLLVGKEVKMLVSRSVRQPNPHVQWAPPGVSKVKRHVTVLIEVLYPDWPASRLQHIWLLLAACSMALMVACLTLLVPQGFGAAGILISVAMGLIPYCYLRLATASRQIEGSYEGQLLLTELLNQYKLHHYNAILAVEKSIPYLEKAPISQKQMYQLALKLKTYQTTEELRDILDDFALHCGTQWAQMLSTNLFYAISVESNVSLGLTDLLKECAYTQKLIEESKRQNNEAFVMIQLLCPAVYVVLVWSLMVHFNFTIGQLIQVQLFTSMGALLFVLIVAGTLGGLMLAKLLARPKFDI